MLDVIWNARHRILKRQREKLRQNNFELSSLPKNTMTLHIPENYSGYIPGRRIGRMAGVSSGVELEQILLSKDWLPFAPVHEMQNKGFETSACGDFSVYDCLEYLFNAYLALGKFSPFLVDWFTKKGYIIDGKFNFADRLGALFSDIIPLVGAYQDKVCDAACYYLIPEAMLPYTSVGAYKNPDDTPGGYFNPDVVTPEILKLVKEFNELITVNWYYVEYTSAALMSSPLQAVCKFANGTGILKPEGAYNHFVCVPKEPEDCYVVDDSYAVQFKKYDKNYLGSFVGFKITINDKTMDTLQFVTENDLKWVQNEKTGQFGRIMQKKLRPIVTADRGVGVLLDDKVRGNKIIKYGKEVPAKLTQAEWDQLPKLDF